MYIYLYTYILYVYVKLKVGNNVSILCMTHFVNIKHKCMAKQVCIRMVCMYVCIYCTRKYVRVGEGGKKYNKAQYNTKHGWINT